MTRTDATATAVAACLAAGFSIAARLFGRLCLGSFVYHVVGVRAVFAMETLPWKRGA